jgi:REP element-mobilizing transposase RayT
MSVKKYIPYDSGIFFITFTCYKWKPLIELVNGYEIIYKWFDYLKSKGHGINGYVIMPNHLHTILSFTKSEKSINTIIGNGKRFMAYEIIRRLENLGEINILTELSNSVSDSEKLRNKKHEVFQPSFDWKYLDNDKIIEQKLSYIHENPIRGLNPLVANPLDYTHSSARFYEGLESVYPLDSIYGQEHIIFDL